MAAPADRRVRPHMARQNRAVSAGSRTCRSSSTSPRTRSRPLSWQRMPAASRPDLLPDLLDPLGTQPFKDRPDQAGFEERIARLDAQNEAVARGALDFNRIEDRVIEERQAAGKQQTEKPAGDRQQQHHLESRDHEGRPAVMRSAADIDRIAPGFVPPL